MESVIKDTASQWYITVVGHSWATFTFSPKGDFFIHSDWGYWAFNWRSFGSDFKAFLSRIGTEYLIDKIETNQFQFYGINKKIHTRQREAITALFQRFQEELKREIETR